MPDRSFSNETFPDIQSEPPLVQPEAKDPASAPPSREALPSAFAVHCEGTTSAIPGRAALPAAQGSRSAIARIPAAPAHRCVSQRGRTKQPHCPHPCSRWGRGCQLSQTPLLSHGPADSPGGSFQPQTHHLPANLAAPVHRCANTVLK